jgi:hypothetical protein
MADLIRNSGPAWDLFVRIRDYAENTENCSAETINGFRAEMMALKSAGYNNELLDIEKIEKEIDKRWPERGENRES